MVANYLLNGMILQVGEVFMMFFVFEKNWYILVNLHSWLENGP